MLTLAALCLFAFCGGLVDAAVGGGGLIQVPALLNLLPGIDTATLFGINKTASASGTFFAARSYTRHIRVSWPVVLPAAVSAFVCAFCGAATVSLVPKSVLRPVVLALMVLMLIYTLARKDFGTLHRPAKVGRFQRIMAVVLGGAIGFYDGLFGPGTGSFLIFLFVRFFAFDFLNASASAKVVNLATNIAALSFFIPTGHVIWSYAIPMAVASILGAKAGAYLAVRQGTRFIRILFLTLTCALTLKLAWDVIGGAA